MSRFSTLILSPSIRRTPQTVVLPAAIITLGALAMASLVAVEAALAQQSADQPLVAPDSLQIGLQGVPTAPPSIVNITAEDVEQLGRDLEATSTRNQVDATGASDNFDPAPPPEQTARTSTQAIGNEIARVQQGRTTGGQSGQQIIRPIDNNPGVGAVGQASGGLTSFSTDIPDAPSSPFDTNMMGPATGRGSVFLEPDPVTNRRLSPSVFEDPTLQPMAPLPTPVDRMVRLRGGSLSGVDAKDLRLRTRARPFARGLNCSPPDLRLEEINDPNRPHIYRLTGVIETPTDGYSYVTFPTAQRSSFIRPTGGPALMAMTLSMKAPELGHHQPDGLVHIDEFVTVSPNAKRLDVLVNNIIFRRAVQYYCRVPGTLN